MTPRAEKLALLVLVALFVVLAGLYNSATPPAANQHNPDENAHVLYVQSLASGRVPVFRPDAPDYEAHQPPLYYALCVPVVSEMRGRGGADTVHALRWVSTLLGALLILTTRATVRGAFPAHKALGLATAGFVALLPMNASLCASVTNDTLANLVCACALLCLVQMARAAEARRPITFWTALLGLTLGVGIWTKTSTLVLWPTVLLACFLLARHKLLPAKEAARAAFLSLGMGLVMGLPWLVRNTALYGDPVAQHVFQTAFTGTAHAAPFVRALGWPAYLLIVGQWTFASFWGVFDSMRCFWGQGGRTPSPFGLLPPVYSVLGIVSVAALVGLRSFLQVPQTPMQKVFLWTLAALTLLTGLAHLRFVMTFFQAQGRYWFPALVPLAFGFAAGWVGLSGKAYKVTLVVLGVGLLALNLYTVLALLPSRFANG